MQIIDFARKGNVVRFYLGNAKSDYHGDDWNDKPYEHNAGEVYDEYIQDTIDIAFTYDALVLEPCSGTTNSWFSKDDMKARKIPCIIIVPPSLCKDDWHTDFEDWIGADGVYRIYFGDEADTLKIFK